MNEKYLQLKDPGRWMEETQLDRARRKRLYEDFEKDEAEKLKQIKKQFVLYFKMNKDDYEKEVIEFGGSLEDFYFYCKQKFGMYEVTIIPKRGRKPKNETN